MRDRRNASAPAADLPVAVTPDPAYTNAPDGGVPERLNGPVLKGEGPRSAGGPAAPVPATHARSVRFDTGSLRLTYRLGW